MNNRRALFLQAIRGPILLITIGILFALHQAGGLPINRTWPLIIIVIGLMKLLERTTAPRGSLLPAPAGRTGPMRPRTSFTGPVVLIAIGVVFLVHSLSPEFQIGELLSRFWPYVLIGWGTLQLLEICFRFFTNRPLPPNGISGLGWFAAVIVCLVGFSAFQVRQASPWIRWAGFERGIRAFGEEHEFSVNPIQQAVGRKPSSDHRKLPG